MKSFAPVTYASSINDNQIKQMIYSMMKVRATYNLDRTLERGRALHDGTLGEENGLRNRLLGCAGLFKRGLGITRKVEKTELVCLRLFQ